MSTLRTKDALLAYYIVLLPCVLTYWMIAERLMQDSSTATNVVYHPAWTVVNYDPSSVEKYKKFINENIAKSGGVKQWNWIFNLACVQEAKILDLGLHAPSTPFRIIPDGTYSIHISSVKNLVLAVQNVADFLRPPFDTVLAKYFPTTAGSSIVGTENTGANDQKWHVAATKDGYTFQNVETGLYLGVSAWQDRAEYQVLQAVSDPYAWWVNPGLKQGSSIYQIHDSVNLRYTLHAAVEVLNDTMTEDIGFTPIIAHDNLELKAPCQMWSFDDGQVKQPDDPEIQSDDYKRAKGKSAEPRDKIGTIPKSFETENKLLRQELQEAKVALNESPLETGAGETLEQTDTHLSTTIRNLLNTYSTEMRNMRQEIVRNEEQIVKMDKTMMARTWLKPLEEWETTERGDICYWESFHPSVEFRRFDSASFNPAPIQVGTQYGQPTFLLGSVHAGTFSMQAISDGWPSDEFDARFPASAYYVLVGDSSRLTWVPASGSFDPKSLPRSPVTGWELSAYREDGRKYDTEDLYFIGHYSFGGSVFVGYMHEGSFGPVATRAPTWHRDSRNNYEVLCYI